MNNKQVEKKVLEAEMAGAGPKLIALGVRQVGKRNAIKMLVATRSLKIQLTL
jgi:hypothetical protein